MAWTKQHRKQYYYRTHRVDGRVVKQYVGHGPEAEFIAEHDAIERADREAKRAADLALERTISKTLQQFQDLEDICDLMARASLLSAGYHQHARGEWRRRRGK